MKRSLMLFGCIACLAAATLAEGRVRITEHVDADGKSTFWYITPERLAKLPAWKTDAPLPLPIEKAIAQATAWIKLRHAKFTEWEIVTVSLGKIWDSDTKNRWYYSVSVNGTANVDGVRASSFFSVIVLMDGSVVEPTEQK